MLKFKQVLSKMYLKYDFNASCMFLLQMMTRHLSFWLQNYNNFNGNDATWLRFFGHFYVREERV